MKTMMSLCVCTAVAIAICTSAKADPPNDCGYNNARGNLTFCGDFTSPSGTLYNCNCFGDETCLNAQYQTLPPPPISQPWIGFCSTNAGTQCGPGHLPCDGYSVCQANGTCCLPTPCSGTVCGDVSDGCGGTQACSNGGRCRMMTLTWPTVVHLGSWYNVSVTGGPLNTNFTVILTNQNGTVLDSYPFTTNGSGSFSDSWQIQPETYGNGGPWSMQIHSDYPSQAGFTYSNVVHYLVEQ